MAKIFCRKRIRLPAWDYASAGFYFVTIVTQDGVHRFGRVVGVAPCGCPVKTECDHVPVMQLSLPGDLIYKWWHKIPKRFINISIDEFAIMPNHIHGIIEIHDHDGQTRTVEGQPQGVAPTAIKLGDIVGWFKSMTTNEYIKNVRAGQFDSFKKRFWQRNYYEHIIRDDDDLNRIQNYIINNPANWKNDDLYL